MKLLDKHMKFTDQIVHCKGNQELLELYLNNGIFDFLEIKID